MIWENNHQQIDCGCSVILGSFYFLDLLEKIAQTIFSTSLHLHFQHKGVCLIHCVSNKMRRLDRLIRSLVSVDISRVRAISWSQTLLPQFMFSIHKIRRERVFSLKRRSIFRMLHYLIWFWMRRTGYRQGFNRIRSIDRSKFLFFNERFAEGRSVLSFSLFWIDLSLRSWICNNLRPKLISFVQLSGLALSALNLKCWRRWRNHQINN